MKLRRLAPVIAVLLVGGVWGFAFVKFGRPPEEASQDRPGAEGQVKKELEELKGEVLGQNGKTRGKKVTAPQQRPPKAYYDYSPREVCVNMKMLHPERYENLDCSDDKFSSPLGWVWSSENSR